MKHTKEFHVLACDASMDEVSLSWAICNEILDIEACAQLQYSRGSADKRSDRFVPSVEYLRGILEANYHDLRCICCTVGPGSFTGIRNTLAFVKGLIAVCAENTPIHAVAVRTHDAIAYRYRNARTCDTPLLVVNDARSSRYYTALYSSGTCISKQEQKGLSVCDANPKIYDYSAEEISAMLGDCNSLDCVGNASESMVETLQKCKNTMRLTRLHDTTCTMVQAVHELGLLYYEKNIHEILALSEPLYIRASVS